jgi:hypothetical protein
MTWSLLFIPIFVEVEFCEVLQSFDFSNWNKKPAEQFLNTNSHLSVSSFLKRPFKKEYIYYPTVSINPSLLMFTLVLTIRAYTVAQTKKERGEH